MYEWGEVGELVFLAMEYVQGNSLREYFNRGTRFDGPDAVSVMAQLLDALHYAHQQGVWHRDIKPANIIVMNNGKLKIADFGIARIDSSNLTQTGAIMGTPGYMAPEQYSGHAVDWRADIFSAGVVLYQLLTGARPFTGSPESIAYKICHVIPVLPSEADPGRCTTQFDVVVMKALAKKPEERYQNAHAFRDALLGAYAAPVSPTVSEETIINEADPGPGAPGALAAVPCIEPGAAVIPHAVAARRLLPGNVAARLEDGPASRMGRSGPEADRAAARSDRRSGRQGDGQARRDQHQRHRPALPLARARA